MKKCPVCEREYDDNMRFCQTDGTALVEKNEPPPDPYKTMVARKEDIAAAIPKETPSSVVPPIPSPLEDEVLEIPPANDPNKTQFVSEAELRAEMEAHSENQVIDVPPATEAAPSAIPISGDQDATPPLPMGSEPPPSPFAAPAADEPGPANFPTSPPIPSPFDAKFPEPESPRAETESPAPSFAEPPSASSAFEPPAQAAPMAQAEINPPSKPEPNMQNPQNFGQQPFNPPASGGGQNSTLAIISLICGILGMTVCCGSFVVSLVAVILGFMARGKATSDPGNYGGAGLALGGIITGAIGLLGSLIVIVLYFFGFAASMMQNM
jgi:hypothetical protein